MKRMVALLTLGLGILLMATSIRAEETPHLQLVRALRAKGYADLALEYLDNLAKSNPPKNIAPFIDLERSNIRLDMANAEPGFERRLELYRQARTGFETFIKSNKNDPLAALAQLEASRIRGLEGRAMMAKSRYLGAAQLKTEMTKINRMYVESFSDMEAAGGEIEKQLKKSNLPPQLSRSLEDALLQAQLEAGINLVDQAATYAAFQDSAKIQEAGKLLTSANTRLKEVSDRDPRGRLGALARAWRVKSFSQMDDVQNAKKAYQGLLGETGGYADEGKRYARYFFIRGVMSGGSAKDWGLVGKDTPSELLGLMEEWLRLYSSHASTLEGSYLRFEAANIYRAQGGAFPMGGPKKDQLDARAKPYFDKAMKLYQELIETESEYMAEAQQYRLDLMIKMASDTDIRAEDIPLIKNHDLCTTAAQIEGAKIAKLEDEIYNLEKDGKDKAKLTDLKKKFPAERKKHLSNAEKLYLQALALEQDPKTRPKLKNALEANANLTYLLLANGDLHRAVAVGEHAARTPTTNPGESKYAAQCAAWALQAYAQLIAEGKKNGLSKEMIEADQARFKKLVAHMEEKWKDDPATDSARHQIGAQLLADKNYRDAEEVLSRVSNNYAASSRIDARYRWCIAAREMLKSEKLDDKEKDHYQKQSIRALEGVPPIPPKAPADVAKAYVSTRLMYGAILYDAKDFAKLESIASELVASIPGWDLGADEKESLLRAADAQLFYAKFGRANAELNAGNYKKSMEMVDAILPKVGSTVKKARDQEAAILKKYKRVNDKALRVSDPEYKGIEKLDDNDNKELEAMKGELEPIQEALQRDGGLYRGLLLIALRANVQEGTNPKKARELLDTLLAEAKADKVGLTVLIHLVAQLKKQIDDLKADSSPKAKEQLGKLTANFSNFLDALAKQQEKLDKLEIGMIFFLANSYSSLDKHAEAATLINKVTKPAAGADPKEKSAYHAARLMYARELRLAKDYDKARKVIDEIEKEPWGKGFEVKKERPLGLMDQEKFGAAAVGWKKIIEEFGGKPDFNNAKIKENYFEAYYQYIYTFYMYAKTTKDPKVLEKVPEYIKRAANLIAKLKETPPYDMGGEGFKKRYDELLAKEPRLKKEFDAIMKEKEKEKKEANKEVPKK